MFAGLQYKSPVGIYGPFGCLRLVKLVTSKTHVSQQSCALRQRGRDVIDSQLGSRLILPERDAFLGEYTLGVFFLTPSVTQKFSVCRGSRIASASEDQCRQSSAGGKEPIRHLFDLWIATSVNGPMACCEFVKDQCAGADHGVKDLAA